MLSIELNTETWIAIVTLLVACISLFVAVMTLLSQKQTEKNTAPDINPQIQYSLLIQYIRDFIYSVYPLYALKYALIKTDYKTKPSHHFWSYFINPEEYLFERVFYDEISNFDYFKSFINQNKRFYEGIELLKVLFDEDASPEEVKKEYKYLEMRIIHVLGNFINLLRNTFNHQTHKSEIEILCDNLLPYIRIDDKFKKWAHGKIKSNKDKEVFEEQMKLIILKRKTPSNNELYSTLRHEVDYFTDGILALLMFVYNIDKNDIERKHLLQDCVLTHVLYLIQLNVFKIDYSDKQLLKRPIDGPFAKIKQVNFYLKNKEK